MSARHSAARRLTRASTAVAAALAGCLLLCPTQPVAALEQILVTAAPNQ